MVSRRHVVSAGLALGLNVFAIPATAQSYPNRPVKIILPFAPGGPTEFIIRLVADRLTATLGQAFIIENRPGGAGGTVGAKSVAIAEPDGYTLLFSSPGPLVTAAAVYKTSTTIRSRASSRSRCSSTRRKCWSCIPRFLCIRCLSW